MNENVSLFGLFPQVSWGEDRWASLSDAQVNNVEMDLAQRAVQVDLDSPRYLGLSLLRGVRR